MSEYGDNFKDLPKYRKKELLKILKNPYFWGQAYLQNRDGKDRRYWPHQAEDLQCRDRQIIHLDGRDVGKTVNITTLALHFARSGKEVELNEIASFDESIKVGSVLQSLVLTKSELAIPIEFSLSQNYPNPFNPITFIQFSVPNDAKVSLKIYNIIGKEVATLINGNVSAGFHKVIWNGRDQLGNPLASGMYFSKMKCGSFNVVRKMVLLK